MNNSNHLPPAILLSRCVPRAARNSLSRRRLAACLAAVTLAACLGHSALAANTESTFGVSGTDLSIGSNYSPTITPTAASGTDVLLAGSYTGGTTFTTESSTLNFGTLNDTDTTQALTIADGTITLNSAANSVSGANASDILYVASGANLTVDGGLKANVTGNFDVAGTAAVNGVLSGAGNITKTGAGTLVLGGANTNSGSYNLSAGTLQLAGTAAMSTSSALTLNNNTTLQLRAETSGTFSPSSITINNSGTYNFDVNHLSAATGQTLTLAGGLTFGNNTSNTINVTGGNGYTLGLGAINLPTSSGGTYTFTINATTAAVNIASFTAAGWGTALTLEGGNTITFGSTASSSNGSFTIAVNGATAVLNGPLTLNNGNNSEVFGFTVSSGTMDINNSEALGFHSNNLQVPSVVLSGGSIDNTSGAPITLVYGAGSPLTAWSANNDFTFGGTDPLNIGAGTFSLSGVTTGVTTRTITVNGTGPLTIGGVISAGSSSGVGLTKSGVGSLALGGDETYTGPTIVGNGVLDITGSLNSASAVSVTPGSGSANPVLSGSGNGTTTGVMGAVTVNSPGTGSSVGYISPSDLGALSEGKLTMSSLTMNGGNFTLFLSSTNSPGSTYDWVNVTGALALSGSTTLSPIGGFAGTYTVITAGSAITGPAPTVNQPASNPLMRAASYADAFNSGSTAVLLTVTGGAAPIIWTGTTNSTWDINTTRNWNDSAASSPTGTFFDGDTVTFGDGPTNTNITIAAGTVGGTPYTSVAPGAIIVNGTTSYTIGGNPISNATGINTTLTKSNTGTLTLTGSNNFTGLTSLNGGILNVGNAGALGGGGNLTFGGGTLQYSSSNQADYSNRIVNSGSSVTIDTNGQSVTYNGIIASSNTGGLTKIGAGTLTLAGANLFTGAPIVNNGTLQIGNGSTGSISTTTAGTVGAGATLAFDQATGSTNSVAITDNGTVAGAEGSGITNTLSGLISGTGGFTQSGAGETILNNASSTFSGNVTIASGTAAVDASMGGALNPAHGPLGNSQNAHTITVNSGATLQFQSSDQLGNATSTIVTSLVVSGTLMSGVGTGSTGASPGVLTTLGAVTLNGGTMIATGGLDFGPADDGCIDLDGTITVNGSTPSFMSATSAAFSYYLLSSLSGGVTTFNVGSTGNPIDLTLSGQVHDPWNGGSGSITKTGSGTMMLSAADSYTGSTTVSAGTLIVSGSLSGSSTVSVTAGGTLEVDGAINAATSISVTSGDLAGAGKIGGASLVSGTLSPGFDSLVGTTGVLTSSKGVTLDGNSYLSIRLGLAASGSDCDTLALTSGTMTLSSPDIELTLGSNIGNAKIGTMYDIITGVNANDISGTFFEGSTITSGAYTFTILYNENAAGTGSGDDVVLDLTSVPEPGTWAMVASGALLILVFRKYRKPTRFASRGRVCLEPEASIRESGGL